MKISYNQIDDVNRQFQLVDGVYSIEKDKSERWIWTSTEFGGNVLNVSNIIFSFYSEIQNVLMYEEQPINIYPNCLTVVKIKVTNKTNFQLKLNNPYIVANDSRVLGVRIMRITIDGDIIF